jgi:hypothetical protein
MIGTSSAKHPNLGWIQLRAFDSALRSTWGAIVGTTILIETMPIPLMSPLPFYTYCVAKLVCFVAMGYLAPLTFWGFNAMNQGIFLAAISAMTAESLQGLLRHGHSFHWYELAVKLALILLGFALGLDFRYERTISVGPIRICLMNERLGY